MAKQYFLLFINRAVENVKAYELVKSKLEHFEHLVLLMSGDIEISFCSGSGLTHGEGVGTAIVPPKPPKQYQFAPGITAIFVTELIDDTEVRNIGEQKIDVPKTDPKGGDEPTQ